ncbi:unnamed protein product [Rotaria magnacalcarata]
MLVEHSYTSICGYSDLTDGLDADKTGTLVISESIQAEFLGYNDSESNVMGKMNFFVSTEYFSRLPELSHRSAIFGKIIQDAERNIREILSISDSLMQFFSYKFALVFASAQKHFSASSLVLVILRKDLIEQTKLFLITGVFLFRIYVANKIFDWIKRQGGVKMMNQLSDIKSSIVYETIDQSHGFYVNSINRKYRSRVNIPFRIVRNGQPDERLESLFIHQAIQSNMIELNGIGLLVVFE